MGLQNARYSCLLVLQLLLLLVDVLCNSIALLVAQSHITLLVLFIAQDIALLTAQIILLLAFLNTFAFTAGLLTNLIKKFTWVLIFGAGYLLISVAYHIWMLVTRWDNSGEYSWTGWLQAMYAVHKISAVGYYYIHKRAAYRLSDPHYYEESEWTQRNMRRH